METDRIDITAQLFVLQDKAYADFQSKLLPTVQRETVIGVRTPDLRKMAKQICMTPAAQEFLHSLPHRYFDENQLHARMESWQSFSRQWQAPCTRFCMVRE